MLQIEAILKLNDNLYIAQGKYRETQNTLICLLIYQFGEFFSQNHH